VLRDGIKEIKKNLMTNQEMIKIAELFDYFSLQNNVGSFVKETITQ